MTNAETVREMFDAYLRGDASRGMSLLADAFRFTSPQDDAIDKAAFMDRCFPTARRVARQEILELVSAGASGVFVMYEYELKSGGRHRNTEFIVVRDGKLLETHVFFGGSYGTSSDRLADQAVPNRCFVSLVPPGAEQQTHNVRV